MFFRDDIDVSSYCNDVDRNPFMTVLLLNHDVRSKTCIASMLKYWVSMATYWVALPFAIVGLLATDGFSKHKRGILEAISALILIPFLIAWFAFTHVKKEESQ